MGLFKKIKKGFGKVLKKVAVPVARGVLSTATGGLSEKAIQAAKALGVSRVLGAKKLQPLSVRGLIERVQTAGPAAKLSMPTGGVGPAPAEVMPGGKRLPRHYTHTSKGGLGLVKGSRKPKRRAKKGTSSAPKRSTGRKPPGGGLDLAAMAAAWRAAGKPGSWRDWIKANPIRKAG